ncbi:MAG: DUF4870 domain-containing protein [Acidobacteria bacterium]|nr:DUF4870 domain-containing protein [Acidobacteriota bacterium]
MLAVAVTDVQPIPTDPVSSESKGWAVAAHVLPLLGLPLVGPLIIWVIKHEDDPFVEEHSREALNFWISVFMYAFISVLLVIVLIGILMLIVLGIFSFVAAIVATIRAASGDEFRYPLTIRLIKP